MSCVTAQCSGPPLKNSGCFLMEYAISELPFASVSERVWVHNLSYGNEFNLKDNRQMQNSFPYERLCTKTRFKTEVKGISEMAYYTVLLFLNSWTL